jgi:hypothetical protein
LDGRLQISGALAVGTYQYDIQVTVGTTVTTWVKGMLTVSQDVT